MELGRAQVIAKEKMREHGLTEKGWTFRFSKGWKEFGHCNPRDREIALSKCLTRANTEERVMLTILHEIAHALVGCYQDHNRIWRRKCIEIGGNGRTKYGADNTECIASKPQRVDNAVFIHNRYVKIGDPVYFPLRGRKVCGNFAGYKPRNHKYPYLVEYMGNKYKMAEHSICKNID